MRGIAAAEDGRGRRANAVSVIDGGLELKEGGLSGGFRSMVPRNCDIDNGARRYGGREEYRGELNLEGGLAFTYVVEIDSQGRTSRLSSVKRTATPASTLPTVSDISIVLCHWRLRRLC